MPQYAWADCPPEIRRQVEQFVQTTAHLLGENLAAVYLHGSLALGGFNPARSDIDLLIVEREGMVLETKRVFAELVLRTSLDPIKMELSVLREGDLHPWRHPARFDFHYSEMWREKTNDELAGGAWQRWNDGDLPRDPDLAAHITITRKRGLCLMGRPIAEALPDVPRADYLASILYDFDDMAEGIIGDPVYYLLNACRIYAYALEGAILSKDEAGAWAGSCLPPPDAELVRRALAIYRGEAAFTFAEPDLAVFARSLEDRVRALL